MNLQVRSAATGARRLKRRVPRLQLPSMQRVVLDIIVRYYRTTGEPCPTAYIARRIERSRATVQEHLVALHTKGWLVTANAPSTPTVY